MIHHAVRSRLRRALVVEDETLAVRSEPLRRPGHLLNWFGLRALFAALINIVMFRVSSEGGGPAGGHGLSFPTVTALLSADGIVCQRRLKTDPGASAES
jgi:hypothetical protein